MFRPFEKATKQLQRINKRRAVADASRSDDFGRQPMHNPASLWGGPPRTGEQSEAIEGDAQEHYENREKFRQRVETATYEESLEYKKVSIGTRLQAAVMQLLSRTGAKRSIDGFNGIYLLTLAAQRKRKLLDELIKDDDELKLAKDEVLRVFKTAIEFQSTMAVGPDIDLDAIGGDGLEEFGL